VVIFLSAGPAWAAESAKGVYFGDVGQAIVALLTFVVLLVVLRKWVWKPMVEQLRHREEAVAKTIESAEKRQKEAEAVLAEYSARMAGVEADSRKVLEESQRKGAVERDRILADAREESRKYAEAAKADIEQARQDALSELRYVAADVATDLAQRVLCRSLTEDDHRRLVEESLQEISQRAAGDS
jgi:F-type H+-transporting ATPase subunit b